MNQTSLPSTMGGLLPAVPKPADKVSGDSHLESTKSNSRFREDMKEANKEMKGDKPIEGNKRIDSDKAVDLKDGQAITSADSSPSESGGMQETPDQVTQSSALLVTDSSALNSPLLSVSPRVVDEATLSVPVEVLPLPSVLQSEHVTLSELELPADTITGLPISPLSAMVSTANANIKNTHLPLQPSSTSGLQTQTESLLGNTAILNKIMSEKNNGVPISLLDKEGLKDFDLIQMTKDIEKPLPSTTPVLSPLASKLSADLLPTNPISLNTSFQSAGQWGQAVTDKVMWMSSKGIKEATIQLDPPELGSLQVKVGVNQDQAQVSFTVQHASVREALDQQSTRLREMFAEEGLNLADVDVSDQSQQQDKETENEGSSGYGQQNSSDEELQATITPIQSRQQSYSLVDAYI
ncbi:flagellar hook-length control protein FliK [Eionea flava]